VVIFIISVRRKYHNRNICNTGAHRIHLNPAYWHVYLTKQSIAAFMLMHKIEVNALTELDLNFSALLVAYYSEHGEVSVYYQFYQILY
jgi:hypothetical protein